ncbi:MAG: hypothetical protein IPM35_27540 [Myxococcales bacterium]|nr:hypothetical protein [Myxococcales bacterium]
MTYRSDEAALAAEREQLEAELDELGQRGRALERELGERRSARLRSRLQAALGLAFVAGVVALAVRSYQWKRDSEQGRRHVEDVESQIRELESRIDQLARVRRIAEAGAPLVRTLGSLGIPHDPELFEAVGSWDPAKPADAWWIVAHAACRLPHASEELTAALGELDAEQRAKAQAFCDERVAP